MMPKSPGSILNDVISNRCLQWRLVSNEEVFRIISDAE